MNILGISCFYHDAAAALVRDGTVIAAAEEERFSRRKHDNGFPNGAIRYCLNAGGIDANGLDAVVFYEKPMLKFDRLLETILVGWPRTRAMWEQGIPVFLNERLRMTRVIHRALGADVEVFYVPHHLSHAAAAFLVSGFEESAILTADGVGEWTTTAWGEGRGTQISIRGEVRFPHSIGLLYSALTAYLGFRVNDAEWKVMGLAAYGRPRYVEPFRRLIEVGEDGSFRLRMEYFDFPWSLRRMHSSRWEELFGRPPRRPEDEIEDFHRDLAHSGQKVVEEVLLAIVRHVRRRTGSDRLCLAGGVALNSVANWRILRETGFRKIFIQPAAGDSGGALGAALYHWNCVLGNPRRYVMTHAYLGPSWEAGEVERVLREEGADYERAPDEAALVDRTARALAEGRIVGWFQGRMEFGPRALGARSILADPRRAEMKDRLNAKVKYRESFRPFAPAVLIERAHEFFEVPEGTAMPFMLLVPPVRPEKRAAIPAVTHADGTARVQTVDGETHPLFRGLIERFGELTGVPVLLNTSYNIRGEPIVASPRDAWRTFVGTGLDLLVIGPFIVRTKPAGRIDPRSGGA